MWYAFAVLPISGTFRVPLSATLYLMGWPRAKGKGRGRLERCELVHTVDFFWVDNELAVKRCASIRTKSKLAPTLITTTPHLM